MPTTFLAGRHGRTATSHPQTWVDSRYLLRITLISSSASPSRATIHPVVWGNNLLAAFLHGRTVNRQVHLARESRREDLATMAWEDVAVRTGHRKNADERWESLIMQDLMLRSSWLAGRVAQKEADLSLYIPCCKTSLAHLLSTTEHRAQQRHHEVSGDTLLLEMLSVKPLIVVERSLWHYIVLTANIPPRRSAPHATVVRALKTYYEGVV